MLILYNYIYNGTTDVAEFKSNIEIPGGSMEIKQLYQKRIEEFGGIAERLDKVSGSYSRLRLVTFAVGTILTILAFIYWGNIYGFIVMALSVFIFAFFVVKHQKIIDSAARYKNLVEINKRCISRMDGSWTDFEDKGLDFADDEHIYAGDLDIFGHASLFQWINTARTYFGRIKLKELLISPSKEAVQIKKRQNAVIELSGKIDFCQNLQCEGMVTPEASENPEELIAYSESNKKLFYGKYTLQLFYVLPELTVIFLILCRIDSSVSIYIPITLLVVQAVISIIFYGRVSNVLRPINKYKNRIDVYRKMIEMIEKEEFGDEYLNELKSRLFLGKASASKQIKGLEKIVDAVDAGSGTIVAVILNLLLFWNIHCAFALEKWKRKSGRSIKSWLETIGEFEALASLALVTQMNPEWAFAEFSKSKVSLKAEKMGHPLINEDKRVCNSINMDNKICIVTGSNMSGKTTLLRTVGINLVLAYAGTAVCAKEFTCSVMDIWTSMRIADDLSGGISTFYAELLRIKRIIDHSRKRIPMIFLIDEVFRGTNSVDRVTGAKNVVLNLDRNWIIGMISTHDFELCKLEQKEGSRIANYHFTETYENNKIKFDYILRPGRSKTTNARYLMKMVGIELLEE